MVRLSSAFSGTHRLFEELRQFGLSLGPVRHAFVEPTAPAWDASVALLLCHYGKRLAQPGLIAGRAGNLSARAASRTEILITPRATNKAHLVASRIVRVPLKEEDGTSRGASFEYPMHRACYLAHERVGAVVHTHAPGLTAAGLRRIDLNELFPELTVAVGGVRLIPYAPSGSDALATGVAEAIRSGAQILLLERHGAVAVGTDITEAVERMELAELSAKAAVWAGV
ncbi:MAG: class II aldolase/adducin family protein [Gemmatimonadetes bacterium]|nr:class II aldolase/adducin family protein [Gemmatimonadota bacterium]